MGKKKQRKKTLNNKKIQQPAIMVGMPIHHYIENFTLMCIDKTMADLRQAGIKFHRVSPIGIPDVARARNVCVDAFLKDKQYTHLMWIDSDMVWDTDAVLSLLNLGVPACSALVTKKAPPFNITLFQLLKPEEDSNTLGTYDVPLGAYPMDKPFRFPNSGIGTAFMLLERKVIEAMEPPYFASFTDAKKALKGTDYYFCVRMLQRGFEFIYDPKPKIYHVGKCLFGVEDHVAYLDQLAEKGIEACQFMNTDASSVVDWKKTFAGPQPSLIEKIAPVVERQKELYRLREESKSDVSKCHSFASADQTKTQTKTGIEVVSSLKDLDHTKLPLHPEKEPTKSMLSGVR